MEEECAATHPAISSDPVRRTRLLTIGQQRRHETGSQVEDEEPSRRISDSTVVLSVENHVVLRPRKLGDRLLPLRAALLVWPSALEHLPSICLEIQIFTQHVTMYNLYSIHFDFVEHFMDRFMFLYVFLFDIGIGNSRVIFFGRVDNATNNF